MRKTMYCTFLFLCCAMLTFASDVRLAELGLEENTKIQKTSAFKGVFNPHRAGGYLLIPDSSADTIGMYDPHDGTYLGDLITNSAGLFTTPINAIMGPDGNIYVSDQVKDTVNVFDTSGNHLYTYADSTDGLDNIRGICFRGDHLFVCSYYGYIAEFDGPHSRLPDFIYNGTHSMWDILFLSNNECLVTSSGTDDVAHYDANGGFIKFVVAADFPQQVQFDSVLPGDYLVNIFSDKAVHDFDINGTIHQTSPHGSYGSGVFRLGNGNLLVGTGTGIHEIDPITGAVIQTENPGPGKFIELVNPTHYFTCDTTTISEAVGGQANFTLDAGVANGGRTFLIFAGVSGTSPGFMPPPGLVTIPVNWDLFTNLALKLANTTIFNNFYGTLDANGQATAGFNTLGPFTGGAGLTLSFAYGADLTYWDFASNPVSIDITP